MRIRFGILWILLVTPLVGCTNESTNNQTAAEKRPTLNVYNWSNYIGRLTIPEFSRETGIEVRYDTYTSNEELVSELTRGARPYDVVFPSDNAVPDMISAGLLAPLDREKLTNFGNVDPRFTKLPYDPENRYCVPYNWGTTGLAINTIRIKKEITSWRALWDDEFRGRVSILNEPRSGFLPALKSLGFSANTTDPKELEQATELLIELKPLLKAFSSDRYLDLLRDGTVWIAVGYSGDVIRLVAERPGIQYVIPQEGTDLWVDNVCIPARARNRAAAHEFINYLLRADVAAKITNDTGFASANAVAKQFIKAEVLQNPAVYPPEEILARTEYAMPLGEEGDIYYELWEKVLKAPVTPRR